MASIAMPENRRSYYLYLAKLSEKAERYDEMVASMEKVVTVVGKSQLTFEERNMLSAAYKNAIASRRAARRIMSSVELKEEGKTNGELVKTYKAKLEEELSGTCGSLIKLLDMYLVPSATTSGVLFEDEWGIILGIWLSLKLAANGSRLLMKLWLLTRLLRILRSQVSLQHTLSGWDWRSTSRFSIMIFSMNQCSMANQAFDEAFTDLNYVAEESYKDNTMIIQLLRDNITIWTSNMQVDD